MNSVFDTLDKVQDQESLNGTERGPWWHRSAHHERYMWGSRTLYSFFTNQTLSVQIQDGVSNDAGGFLLVAPWRHHKDGDSSSPCCPEDDLISLYDTLKERWEYFSTQC